ncbi:MAG: hypothetical protein AB7F88_09215 [Pyrinomonadaceae bacterium]
MLVRIYWTLCAAFLLAALVLFLTGNLTMTVLVVFGFIGFGLVFMGMISVLPATISHPAPRKAGAVRTAPVYAKQSEKTEAVRSATAWFHPDGVETRRPEYR